MLPTDALVSTLLFISALGIYIHALFLSISLGLPWIIISLVYKWWRTGDRDHYEAARTATGVLGLNFALGAITGTLVEFGLVQAWSGSIFVIATFGFMPLTLELVAFVGEIVFLIMFIVTFGRVKPTSSIGIMAAYIAMAVFSGAVITTVNSWLNVPWGTGALASSLYPFLPQYGPNSIDIPALVRLKVELMRNGLTSGTSSQILQDPTLAHQVGLTLRDPFAAFFSPYAAASVLHNVNAGMIVGISFGLVGYAYRFFRTGNERYIKIIRAFLPVLLIMLVLQPTVFGDFMGKMVASNQPTKFALIEGAQTTTQNPLISFLAYGDPTRSIIGFDNLKSACHLNNGKTLGDLISKTVPGLDPGPASSISLSDICLGDLSKAEARLGVLNTAYYSKVASGIVAVVALVALASSIFRVPFFAKIVDRILGRLGSRRKVFLLSLLILFGSVSSAILGWFVRETGRKPWTAYGLLYPSEIVTPVPIDPPVLLLFTMTFVAMAVVGLFGIYIVATRRLRFIELLRKGAGVE